MDEPNLLSTQLADIQTQLSQLSSQLAQVNAQLGQIPVLSEKVTQLEDNLLLIGDIHRYEKLKNYLANHQWWEADQETIRLIVDISGHKEIEDLTPNDMQKFPCNDLDVIDKLWLNYSNGRFGFSVQVGIYQEVGGTVETTVAQNRELIEDWGERLGWRSNDQWRKCNELDYTLNAPVGCHPSRWWNSPYGSRMTNNFLSRLLSCQK